MAFEIFKAQKTYKSKRLDECKDMFSELAKDENLAARVDMSPSNVYQYARKLGYRVYVRDEHNGKSIVKVVKSA